MPPSEFPENVTVCPTLMPLVVPDTVIALVVTVVLVTASAVAIPIAVNDTPSAALIVVANVTLVFCAGTNGSQYAVLVRVIPGVTA